MATDHEKMVNSILRLLARPRNRIILRYLRRASVSSPHILAICITEQYPNSRSIEEEKVHLHHQHLPKLEDHNLISYDERTKTVRDESCDLTGQILESIDEWKATQ